MPKEKRKKNKQENVESIKLYYGRYKVHEK